MFRNVLIILAFWDHRSVNSWQSPSLQSTPPPAPPLQLPPAYPLYSSAYNYTSLAPYIPTTPLNIADIVAILRELNTAKGNGLTAQDVADLLKVQLQNSTYRTLFTNLQECGLLTLTCLFYGQFIMETTGEYRELRKARSPKFGQNNAFLIFLDFPLFLHPKYQN